MAWNGPMNKLDEYRYEIPQTYKIGMRTSGVIYASARMLEQIRNDDAPEQVANVAYLPGILGKSLAMPDIHWGYGFSIGGVAATDADSGVISPGGVGYDINCLARGTKVLTGLGYWLPIEEFEANYNASLVESGNVALKLARSSVTVPAIAPSGIVNNRPVLCFMKKSNDKRMLRLRTRSGLELLATDDHPVLTARGMKEAGMLSAGDSLAITLFEGVRYEAPCSELILTGAELGCSDDSRRELENRSLIPLAFDNPAVPILAKLLGYLMGEGCVYFSGKTGYVQAYGTKDDLESINADLAVLGYSANIYKRERTREIIGEYGKNEFASHCYELRLKSTSFARLILSLGMPNGKKTSQDYAVPKWLFASPKWVKRLFLAGLFGAGLSSPKMHSKMGFSSPIFTHKKNNANVDSGREFAIGVMRMLEDLGVRCTKLSVRNAFRNKHVPMSTIRLLISTEDDNLLRLWRNVGFEYNKNRRALAEIAAHYILLKKAETAERKNVSAQAMDYKSKGLRPSEIKRLLCKGTINERFIECSLHGTSSQMLDLVFEEFDTFAERARETLANNGALFDELIEVSSIGYEGEVYDITVSEDHNFVANSFVVSNCGVRLVRTNLTTSALDGKLVKRLIDEIFVNVPSGVGSQGKLRLDLSEMNRVLEDGAHWAVRKGYGWDDDLAHLEENGQFKHADNSAVEDKAKQRGASQLGTLGAGNHFLEIQKVDEIFDAKIANAFGIKQKGQIMVMIHTGSRGLGHQVCTDNLRTMEQAVRKYNISLPDRQLACAPVDSPEAKHYNAAMACAANYAWANRQLIVHWVREAFEKVLGRKAEELDMHIIYDVAHNIAKLEEHIIEGARKKVYVHRKGATRAFVAGRQEIPQAYREVGQPVLIPGDMGRASYVLVGTERAMVETFGSTCHGAGRTMSREEAIRRFKDSEVKSNLSNLGIYVRGASRDVISEEAPEAYKNVNDVVDITHGAGISIKVAKLIPLGVMKG